MSTLSIGISPGPRDTRVIAMAGPRDTILKARLSRHPSHPRALPTLLEAIALWQGVQVHAALCAADRDGASDSSLYREAFADFGGPLYTLEWIPAAALDRRRRRDLRGVGDFADLRRLLIEETTR
ncbi:MAG: hypothetical protein ACREJ3_09595 [Polyangiaceae bacterium]